MYSNILVPFDNSEHAQHALLAAIDLAQAVDKARVTVLNVTDLLEFDDATFEVAARMAGVPRISEESAHAARESYYTEQEKLMRKSIEEFLPEIPETVDLQIKIVSGRPQEVIVETASDEGYDCIVMGSRGLGALRGALGSVSYAVLRAVDIPVVIIK